MPAKGFRTPRWDASVDIDAKGPFSFLKLPPEIRVQVYETLLYDADDSGRYRPYFGFDITSSSASISQSSVDFFSTRNSSERKHFLSQMEHRNLGPWHGNRLIQEEAMDVYLKRNILLFDISSVAAMTSFWVWHDRMDKATIANIRTVEVQTTAEIHHESAWPKYQHATELATFKLSIQKEGKAMEIRTHCALDEGSAFRDTFKYLVKNKNAYHLRLQVGRYMRYLAPNGVLNGLDLVQMANYIGSTEHTEVPCWIARERHKQCSAGDNVRIRCGIGPDCSYRYNTPIWTFRAKQGEILDMKTYVEMDRADIREGWEYVVAYEEIPQITVRLPVGTAARSASHQGAQGLLSQMTPRASDRSSKSSGDLRSIFAGVTQFENHQNQRGVRF